MKKGIRLLLIVNIFSLFMGIVNSFFLPKMLSLNDFGMIKSFQLYLTYVGFLHFGYIDGMYLKYGGKKIEELNHKLLSKEFFNFILTQIGVLLILLIINIFLNDYIIWAVLITIIPYNCLVYYMMFYQSVGKFGEYSKINFFKSFFIFLSNMLLLLLFKEFNYEYFVNAYVGIYLLFSMLWGVSFIKLLKSSSVKFDFLMIKDNILSGVSLMLGNAIVIVITGLDRWLIKIFMDIEAFAYYSFAVSAMIIMEVFVSPITTTLYNYLSNIKAEQERIFIKNSLIIVSFGMILASFVIKLILETYLHEYISSSMVVFILFAAQALIVVIKGLYVNLYKVNQQQKIYFKKLVLTLFAAIILGMIFISVFKTIESTAISTLIAIFIWGELCEQDFNYLKSGKREYIYKIVLLSIYFILSIFTNSIVGFIVYFLSFILLTYTFYNQTSKRLISIMLTTRFKRFKNLS